MSWETPGVADFKAQFVRDFNYGTIPSKVMDSDIESAIELASIEFNGSLPFATDAQSKQVFLLLAAYYLVASLRNSAQGVGSQCNFPVSSRSVGGVAITFTVPEQWVKRANFAHFTMNQYGMLYLQMVYPFTIGGGVGIVEGDTTWG